MAASQPHGKNTAYWGVSWEEGYGYVPRMFIQHTSSQEQGQIYIGTVNWALRGDIVSIPSSTSWTA